MKCPSRFEDNLDAVLDYCTGTASPATSAWLELHMTECPACRELVGAQTALFRSLDDLPPVEVPADFDERLFQRITEEKKAHPLAELRRAAWDWARRPLVAVATVSTVFVCLLVIERPWTAPTPSPVAANPARAADTPGRVDIEAVESVLEDLDLMKDLAAPVHPGHRNLSL